MIKTSKLWVFAVGLGLIALVLVACRVPGSDDASQASRLQASLSAIIGSETRILSI